MTLSEKSAYLKGLMDGLKLDTEKPEGQMISGIVELLQGMTSAISDLEENAIAVSDELDEIEDDLDAIEEFLMDDEDGDDDEGEDDGYDVTDGDGEDFDYDEDVMYDVTCPKCGNEMQLTEDELLNEPYKCPKCGEPLEFEFDEDDEDDEG